MNQKVNTIKTEIHTIANYQALLLSKYYITAILLLISLYLGFLRYNLSSLYILIVLNIFPHALSILIKDLAGKTENRILVGITIDNNFQLSKLKRKYLYSKLKYVSNSITYLITLFLIGLWQSRNNIDFYLRDDIKNLPFLVLLTGLSLRLLSILYYRIKLPYDLSHNKV